MKKMLIGLILIMSIAAHADAGSKVISSRTVVLPVDISLAKVKKTNAGYGTTYLVKILVPELSAETVLNHRNEGEGAPCLATYDTGNLDDVIQNNPKVEKALFTINLIKSFFVDADGKACHLKLTENITTKVRGFNFEHNRSQALPDRVPQDCN